VSRPAASQPRIWLSLYTSPTSGVDSGVMIEERVAAHVLTILQEGHMTGWTLLECRDGYLRFGQLSQTTGKVWTWVFQRQD
jgi:hypothetical protein